MLERNGITCSPEEADSIQISQRCGQRPETLSRQPNRNVARKDETRGKATEINGREWEYAPRLRALYTPALRP